MQKSRIYWITQLIGWLTYFTVNFFFFYTASVKDILFHLLLIPSAILLTHAFRYFIIKKKWLQQSVLVQISIAIVASLLLSPVFISIQYFLTTLIFETAQGLSVISFLQSLINFWFVFFVWSVLYFSFHYIRNYRKAEIQQLKMQGSLKEAELNKLKSQLNPHFMFNAMNSIRALIDENPQKAKEAVTQLSNILRQTLTLEKNKLISFDDEMTLVKDYLALEKIRFEERLNYSLHIDESSSKYKIPPMLLQTLVENAIKHGISKLTEGGAVDITTKQLENTKLQIEIINTGNYNPDANPQSGYGLANTKNRLAFVFADDASFSIVNENHTVKTQIIIPLL
ncbi:MAG TPA: histidine kinase [Bacteroidia bacterium]|jgi:two-component system LytT family sensor kinase|nr:histidine kinase [Bacteroidia bacterium]